MNESKYRWLLPLLGIAAVMIAVLLALMMPMMSGAPENSDSSPDDEPNTRPADISQTSQPSSTSIMLDDVTQAVSGNDDMPTDSIPSFTPLPTNTAIAPPAPVSTETSQTTHESSTGSSQTDDGTPTPRLTHIPTNDSSSQTLSDATDVPFATPDTPDELNLIGNGSAFVFHNDHVKRDENTLVELQVFFDEFYITATPTSAITAIPATALERPSVDLAATQTPRAARFTEAGIDLPERLIAWLECNDQFTNCGDGGVLPMRIQSINSWQWSITPKDDVRGSQDLRIELWTVDSAGDRDQRIWTRNFQISVSVDFLQDNSNMVIAGLIGLILLLIALFAILRWRDYRATHHNRPTVFISYRRLVSAGFGRALHDSLVTAGADVFIDIDDIHAGSFSDYIKDNIRERDYFLILLAPRTLESTWVIQEILYALEHNRTIIPVLLNDFDLYGDEMPDNLTFLQQQNAVTLPVEHFESGVNRIKTFIGLK